MCFLLILIYHFYTLCFIPDNDDEGIERDSEEVEEDLVSVDSDGDCPPGNGTLGGVLTNLEVVSVVANGCGGGERKHLETKELDHVLEVSVLRYHPFQDIRHLGYKLRKKPPFSGLTTLDWSMNVPTFLSGALFVIRGVPPANAIPCGCTNETTNVINPHGSVLASEARLPVAIARVQMVKVVCTMNGRSALNCMEIVCVLELPGRSSVRVKALLWTFVEQSYRKESVFLASPCGGLVL